MAATVGNRKPAGFARDGDRMNMFTVGEKVLTRGVVARQGVVVADFGADEVLVALAPNDQRSEDLLTVDGWDQLSFPRKQIRRYTW